MGWPAAIDTWDRETFLWLHRTLHGFRSPALDAYLRWVNELGNGYVLVAIVGLWIALRPSARSAGRSLLQAGLAVGLTALATRWLKAAFSHARPQRVFADRFRDGDLVAAFGENLKNYAFPSGHTATAFALALVVSVWARAIPSAGRRRFVRILAFALAASTGVARVYAGAHFPLDVAAGALEGLLCATLTLLLVRPPMVPGTVG